MVRRLKRHPRRNFIRENILRIKPKKSRHELDTRILYDILTPNFKGWHDGVSGYYLNELRMLDVPFKLIHLYNHATQTDPTDGIIFGTGIVRYATLRGAPKYKEAFYPSFDDIDVEYVEVPPTEYLALPDFERKDTLRVLRELYAENKKELNRLPLRKKCATITKRRAELEKTLCQINDGMKIFQERIVFVKIIHY